MIVYLLTRHAYIKNSYFVFSAEYGIVSGLSNAAFLGIILGSLLFVCGIGALIYYCKR